MKKYITLAALLAAGTAFANAENIVETTGSDIGASVTNGYTAITGIVFDLDLMTWTPEILKTGSLTLDSISFSSTAGKHTNTKFYSGNIYAHIYENSITKNDVAGLTAVAVSKNGFEWNSTQNANSGTWEFESVALDLTKTYTLLFSKSKDSFSLALGNNGAGEGIRSSIMAATDGVKVVNYNGTAFSDNSVDAKISGSAVAIPEPSAFGLLAGLGALALVGTRRRRK